MWKHFLFFLFFSFIVIAVPQNVTSGGCEIIDIAVFESDKLIDGAPKEWNLEISKGNADLALVQEKKSFALRLRSDAESSYGIKKEIRIKTELYPFLNWTWKVSKLPKGADVRKKETDDQAIQLYVAFEPTGWPAKLNTPIIGYIWDTESPKELKVTSPQPMAGKVRYIVLRNKEDKRNEWYDEKRNIVHDFIELFPELDKKYSQVIQGISFYINSQHTKTEAESFIYNVYSSSD